MSSPADQWSHICAFVGKRSYKTKKAAKAAGRQLGGGTNAYRCQPDPNLPAHYHFGHLPKPVVAGELTRDDIRRRYPIEER